MKKELEALRKEIELLRLEIQVLKLSQPVYVPLIGDIVDRENACGPGKKGIALFPDLEIRRDKRGLPVVAMDNIGLELQVLTKLEAGTRKKTETLGIIREFPIAVVIKPGAAKIAFMLDEIDRKSVRFSLENLAPHDAVAGRNAHRPQNGFQAVLLPTDGPITRQDKPDIMPEFLQDLGQRAANVSETAGLDKRHRL